MKAVVLDEFGDVDVMKISETQKPVPQEGQILIRVAATSVNGPDIVQRKGKYPPPKGESDILGLEVAGVVEACGRGVQRWHAGERVMALVGGGGYAEYAIAYETHVIPMPDNMSFEEAACICETYLTAFSNIFLLGEFRNGETILIHGAGGGVNTAALQLCKTLRPRSTVIVTASPGKIERVKSLGADHVINYKKEDFADAVKMITRKKGVDVILDHVGAAYLPSNMKSLAVGGRLIVIGVISGIKAELNLALMMVKRQQIIGSVLRPRSVKEKGEIITAFTQQVWPRLKDRTIVPVIHQVFPMEAVGKAHKMMEESGHFGKIVLKIGI
jgi:putative PIG3 family NAD(P)H quinone oxidoreductase